MASNQELRALGHTLGEIQDHLLAARPQSATSERLAGIHQARALRALRTRRAWRWRALGLLASAAAVLLALSFRAGPLGFVVGTAKAPGQLGVWVAATLPEPTALAFSDGSRLLLQAGAQARVVSTNEHGARIVLERGSARAEVVPRAKNDWIVVGGPFEIQVTGTRFDADWQPEQQALRVTMYEGHVVIRADCLGAPRTLAKGESVALSCRPARAPDPSPTAAAALLAPPVVTNASPPSSEQQRGVRAAPLASEAPPAGSAPEPPASWRMLAQQGKYKAALGAAEQAGFDEACRTLSASELLELGTTARLAGSLPHASAAYTALRERFADTDSAATAAFHLGQMAFDSAGAYAEAKKWFAAYLSERPVGVLAAEALGRKMEAEQRTGDLSAARSTASIYLSRYSAGAHARLATSLLNP